MTLVASRILKSISLFILAFYCYSCSNNGDYLLIEGSTMGTTYNIKYSSSSIPLYQVQKEIDNILDLINNQMSTYQNDSEISIFNNMPQDSLISISDEFYYVLEKSKYYYDLSEGEFDITISNLSDIWGFDKNGFIKTPYETKNKLENTYGILLLGNSVAMGEGLYGFDNEKTFASQLEKNLRNENPKIDLVNAAYAGFNTWQ